MLEHILLEYQFIQVISTTITGNLTEITKANYSCLTLKKTLINSLFTSIILMKATEHIKIINAFPNHSYIHIAIKIN